tara:strand:+ start:451 stop:633 length:183 start_codon:yes stop_codon:yes gene_type:complete
MVSLPTFADKAATFQRLDVPPPSGIGFSEEPSQPKIIEGQCLHQPEEAIKKYGARISFKF